MTRTVLGIDVSKQTLDVSIIINGKLRHRRVDNTDAGCRALLAWLNQAKTGPVHACLEATGRYSMPAALALHDAGHAVSLINPAYHYSCICRFRCER